MFDNFEIRLISGELDIKKTARLQISMFNPFCSGKYLIALSKWIVSNRFQFVEFQVSDTLQRFNFMWRDQIGSTRARIRAAQCGEQWLSINLPAVLLCFKGNLKVSISRWDFWLQHEEFPETLKFFKELSESDPGFREVLDEEIESYFEKLRRPLNNERRDLSREFLIEEIAVSEISAKYYPANEIYPGPRFAPEQYLVEHIVSNRNLFIRQMRFIHVEINDRNLYDYQQPKIPLGLDSYSNIEKLTSHS